VSGCASLTTMTVAGLGCQSIPPMPSGAAKSSVRPVPSGSIVDRRDSCRRQWRQRSCLFPRCCAERRLWSRPVVRDQVTGLGG
jgi:hypothetical protein